MIARNFPPNKTLKAMQYHSGNLTISFNKGQDRVYEGVDTKTAYALYYMNTASNILSYYANFIKGKFNVKTVTNL